jgi:excisionase family DNA binding protein
MNEEIIQRLQRIEQLTLLAAKEALNVDEVALLTGYKKQTIYNMIHNREIPFYRPEGKNVRFSKSEINDWLLQNRQRTQSEISAAASLHTVTNNSSF